MEEIHHATESVHQRTLDSDDKDLQTAKLLPAEVRGNERWWMERELFLLILLVLATYFVRVTTLPIYGEEPRRGLIAREMTESGDWIVPRTQGILRPTRPPLQNWLIIISTWMTGGFNEWAVRLPSLVCMLGTVILLYGYARGSLGKVGAFAAAAAFATMSQVLEYGRLGETEAVFTFFVAGSMLLWHWGWTRGWPEWQSWTAGYAFASLGVLTKGIQAPIYFIGGVGLYLLATRQWKAVLRPGHFIGLLCGPVLFYFWQYSFFTKMGLADSWRIYYWNLERKVALKDPYLAAKHFVLYPMELFGVSTMPWSLLLLAYFSRKFRETLGHRRDMALFLAIVTAWALPFVWISPYGRTRYFMPLYPCIAALIGIAVDQLASSRELRFPTALWNRFGRGFVGVMVLAAVALPIAAVVAPDSKFAFSFGLIIPYSLVAVGLSFFLHQSLKESLNGKRMMTGMASIVLFLSITAVGPAMTFQSRRCNRIGDAVTAMKSKLPPQVRLVSLNQTHHAFAFYYGEPIPVVEWNSTDSEPPQGVEYFCVRICRGQKFNPQFPWTRLDVVNCDRLHRTKPDDHVIVGRIAREQVANVDQGPIAK